MTGSVRSLDSRCTLAWRRGRMNATSSSGCVGTSVGRPSRKSACRSLFKEWKSHANLRAFDTANPCIAEGLIWASLCAAVLTRYCAHATESIARVPISTQRVSKCIHHLLADLLYALMHRTHQLLDQVTRAIAYLARNAQRAHPKRDRTSGRLKLGLQHVHACA